MYQQYFEHNYGLSDINPYYYLVSEDHVAPKEKEEDSIDFEDESDEEENGDESKGPYGHINDFWGMPVSPPSKPPSFTPEETTYYQRSKHVKESQIFKNKEHLKLNLGLKCVEEGFEFEVTRSSKERF